MRSTLRIKLLACSSVLSLFLLGHGSSLFGQATTTEPKARAKATAKAKARSESNASTLLDLNTATAEEMAATLPGVGEVTAKKIVAGRPYAKVDDLAKTGVPARTIDAIRGMVTVAPAEPETRRETQAIDRPEQIGDGRDPVNRRSGQPQYRKRCGA